MTRHAGLAPTWWTGLVQSTGHGPACDPSGRLPGRPSGHGQSPLPSASTGFCSSKGTAGLTPPGQPDASRALLPRALLSCGQPVLRASTLVPLSPLPLPSVQGWSQPQHTYTKACAYMCACKHTHPTRVCALAGNHVHRHVHVHVHMHSYRCTYMSMFLAGTNYTQAHTRVHLHLQTHRHTNIQVHMQTQIPLTRAQTCTWKHRYSYTCTRVTIGLRCPVATPSLGRMPTGRLPRQSCSSPGRKHRGPL